MIGWIAEGVFREKSIRAIIIAAMGIICPGTFMILFPPGMELIMFHRYDERW
jgi:hypothetical protein